MTAFILLLFFSKNLLDSYYSLTICNIDDDKLFYLGCKVFKRKDFEDIKFIGR